MIPTSEVAEIKAFLRWARARIRLLDVVDALVTGESDIPQFKLPVRSMTRRIYRNPHRAPPRLPFGWTARRSWMHASWDVGPWWYLRGRELVDQTRRAFYSLLLYKLKWATVPDGGYYHEVKWRFLEETKW